MRLQRKNFDIAAKTALSEDDRYVLNMIYQSRLRTFIYTFSVLLLFVGFLAFPYLLSDNLELVLGGVTAIFILAIVPGTWFFIKRVLVYKWDINADFKFVIYEEVIRKEYFHYTNQYFLGLNDVNYMHHEVSLETYERVQVGDLFPVFFAAKSRYPFTLRARITFM